MKPSDFQKTVQCRFESCLKKVVRSVVKDYYKAESCYEDSMHSKNDLVKIHTGLISDLS